MAESESAWVEALHTYLRTPRFKAKAAGRIGIGIISMGCRLSHHQHVPVRPRVALSKLVLHCVWPARCLGVRVQSKGARLLRWQWRGPLQRVRMDPCTSKTCAKQQLVTKLITKKGRGMSRGGSKRAPQ